VAFDRYEWLWVDYLPLKHGVSFGLHIDWYGGRVDLHFGPWIASCGRIPIHLFRGKPIAVSWSYHLEHRWDDLEEYDRPRR
jgi:hypothetical protein